MIKLSEVKMALILAVVIGAFMSGFWNGKNYGRDKELRKTAQAWQMGKKVNEEISKLDDTGVCLALGGLPETCRLLMRRMDKAP